MKLVKEENGIKYFDDGSWIDLSNLTGLKPKDYKNIIVKFYYKDVFGETVILNYENGRINFYYNNKTYNMGIKEFKWCHFGNVVKDIHAHKYNTCDTINNLKILDNITIKTKRNYSVKGYLVKCLKDGYEFEIRETDLMREIGCPICNGKRVVKEINSIWKLRPDLVKYFKNPIDAETHALNSNKKARFKCLSCGFEYGCHAFS